VPFDESVQTDLNLIPTTTPEETNCFTRVRKLLDRELSELAETYVFGNVVRRHLSLVELLHKKRSDFTAF